MISTVLGAGDLPATQQTGLGQLVHCLASWIPLGKYIGTEDLKLNYFTQAFGSFGQWSWAIMGSFWRQSTQLETSSYLKCLPTINSR
jgi:hypothetical protein